MSKKPTKSVEVSTGKQAKAIEDPAKWKDHFVSWQINRIDEGGDWGLNKLIEYEFQSAEAVVEKLGDNIHNDLFDAVLDLGGKTFEDLDVFLSELGKKSNENITAQQQRVILMNLRRTIFWGKLFPKIKSFESMTWKDIEKATHGDGRSNSHSVSVSRLSKEAQQRLSELKLDDYEELFSLRLEGKIRMYGVRQFSYLQIIWFDLNHTVIPVGYN